METVAVRENVLELLGPCPSGIIGKGESVSTETGLKVKKVAYDFVDGTGEQAS